MIKQELIEKLEELEVDLSDLNRWLEDEEYYSYGKDEQEITKKLKALELELVSQFFDGVDSYTKLTVFKYKDTFFRYEQEFNSYQAVYYTKDDLDSLVEVKPKQIIKTIYV